MRTQSFRPRVRRLTFQAIAGGEEIHCHGQLHHFPSACKLVRSLPSRCDCHHKKGVFYDWAALPVLRAKSHFQNRLGPRWRANLACKRGTSSCDLWPDGRGAAWPYAGLVAAGTLLPKALGSHTWQALPPAAARSREPRFTLPIHDRGRPCSPGNSSPRAGSPANGRSEEHTSELQSLRHLVCRLLL